MPPVRRRDYFEVTERIDPAGIVIQPLDEAAGAPDNGEIDWYEDVLLDLVPMLAGNRNVTVTSVNPSGYMGIMRFNQLNPPFNNPGIRRAVLGAIDRSEIMPAVAGSDPAMWDAKVGVT